MLAPLPQKYSREDDAFRDSADSDTHAAFFAVAMAASLVLHVALGWAASGARFDVPGGDASAAVRRELERRAELSVRARIVAPDEDPAAKFNAPRPEAQTRRDETPPPFEPGSDVPGAALLPPPVAPDADPAYGAGLPVPDALSSPEDSAPEPWAPRAELLEIASRFANDDLAALPRLELPDVVRVPDAPDFSAVGTIPPLSSGPGAADAFAGVFADAAAFRPAPLPSVIPDLSEPEEDDAPAGDAAPVALPSPPGAAEDATPEAPAAFLPELPEEVAPAKPLDDVLAATVATFRPVPDDGHLYFRIDVRRKGPDVLPPIPRDILFAVDTSRSIAPDRLKRSVSAFRDIAARQLRPGDRFEALAFNATNRYAFGGAWRSPTPAALGDADTFYDSLRPDGNTDLYGALLSAFSLPAESGRARFVVLASDGVPTTGEVRRDSEIIGRLSAANAGETSVYGAGIARKTDEFLLSMLSLCNRGGRAVVSRDRYEVDKSVRDAFDEIGTPVLCGIRFVFDSASGAVVAPSAPGNLRLEQPLSLWGRVPLDSPRQVLFEARGENGGRTYDMVFDLPLGNPAPGSGDKSIASEWARARLYDLVAEHVRRPSAALRAEMAAIGAAYRLPVPFADRL